MADSRIAPATRGTMVNNTGGKRPAVDNQEAPKKPVPDIGGGHVVVISDEARRQIKDAMVAPGADGDAVADARAVLDQLPRIPPAPKDAAGQRRWLDQAEAKLAEAKAARETLSQAWFDGKYGFDQLGAADDQLFDFEGRVMAVRAKLSPTKAEPAPAGSADPGRPLFQATSAVGGMLDKHPNSGLAQTAGGVALPFAVTFDMLDLVTRPLQWLDKVQQKQK